MTSGKWSPRELTDVQFCGLVLSLTGEARRCYRIFKSLVVDSLHLVIVQAVEGDQTLSLSLTTVGISTGTRDSSIYNEKGLGEL